MFDFLTQGLGHLQSRRNLAEPLRQNLGLPIEDLYSRPCKEVRARLVHLGFGLIRGTLPEGAEALACGACGAAIEALHNGSLIVDDIQDQSEWRRGAPTLHLTYGVPVALNAGNWLYFHAFQKVKESGLSAEKRVAIYEWMEEILREAHMGQALDVGTDVTQLDSTRMAEISAASLELKTGALMSLALLMGAVIANATSEQLEQVREFGLRFGISLQQFDDLGNLRVDRPTRKHLEDLALRRPSYVWQVLAEDFPHEIESFREAVKELPQTAGLEDFLKRVGLRERGRKRALEFQQGAFQYLRETLNPQQSIEEPLRGVAEKVANAY